MQPHLGKGDWHAYDIMSRTRFSRDDAVVVKNLHLLKNYKVTKLIPEFQDQEWNFFSKNYTVSTECYFETHHNEQKQPVSVT